jgi:hypothetical protein
MNHRLITSLSKKYSSIDLEEMGKNMAEAGFPNRRQRSQPLIV